MGVSRCGGWRMEARSGLERARLPSEDPGRNQEHLDQLPTVSYPSTPTEGVLGRSSQGRPTCSLADNPICLERWAVASPPGANVVVF